MNFSFTFTKEEWIKLRKKYLFRAHYIKPGEMLLACMTILLAVTMIALNLAGLWAYVLILIGIAYFLYLAFLYFIQPYILFGKNKDALKDRVYSFSEEGMVVRVGDNTENIPWKAIEQFDETALCFFIIRSKEDYFTIPKRCLQSEEEEALKILLEDELILKREKKQIEGVRWF